ncbi:DNA polymerase III subunit delta' [Sphingomonas sp. LY29]|uniref:DNA polymerase III subunit delta' n=1 Tax=Sphingomonas sp. LY29 TaxID=3095341 RepID=UPI002D7A27BD|nr:DNA polymerase III subunit delta' [Sphingomonas sp. LY29]WRP26135.1 DNA polymerase III subunit delta' [Sphingomonas sp. LY29]
MERLFGQSRAVEQFSTAWAGRRLHHAWLLAGPSGVGKAMFARMASTRVLADAAGPVSDEPDLGTPTDHPVARLLSAGSHPDFRWLRRLEKPTGGLARNISVDQVRSLGDLLSVTPSLSSWRAIVIDSADHLEASAANALLKMLEEPPPSTLFFLVSHAPGRLLPTIRSRCRRLDFARLDNDSMKSVLSDPANGLSSADIERLIGLAQGSPGRAMSMAKLDLAPLEEDARRIMRDGDADNIRRSKLASSLSTKAAADRYSAFLALVPALIAREAITASGEQRGRALTAYARARETTALAPRLSLDPGATVFQLGGILASVALKR